MTQTDIATALAAVSDRSDVAKSIQRHLATASFLANHGVVIESLSYDVMSDKIDDWNEVPFVSFSTYSSAVNFYVHGPNQKQTMRALRSAISGKWDKRESQYSFSIEQTVETVHGDVKVSIAPEDRSQICQKVVTTETIFVEAQEARVEEVEHVEWVCGNLLED